MHTTLLRITFVDEPNVLALKQGTKTEARRMEISTNKKEYILYISIHFSANYYYLLLLRIMIIVISETDWRC